MNFLEDLNEIFTNIFPELWKLGQAYFIGELYVRVDVSKHEEYKVKNFRHFKRYSSAMRDFFGTMAIDDCCGHISNQIIEMKLFVF